VTVKYNFVEWLYAISCSLIERLTLISTYFNVLFYYQSYIHTKMRTTINIVCTL